MTKQVSKSASSDNPHRKPLKKGLRSKSTIMRLNMYKGGKPVRDKQGKVVGGTLLMDSKSGGVDIQRVARIAPNRRWFGNTRTISSTDIEKYRNTVRENKLDPYSVIIRNENLPIPLFQDKPENTSSQSSSSISFETTFGDKQQRKRPNIETDFSSYLKNVEKKYEDSSVYDMDTFKSSEIQNSESIDSSTVNLAREDIFSKGQSKRIWSELYKVLDCSDVILEVIDARDIPGTRCQHVENYIKTKAVHKHLVIVINKCDLVPSWVTKKWMKIISSTFPVVAFHASITNSFGKGTLINLLRQFSVLHADKRQISVGVIGYPNTGKSSVINTLLGNKSCKTAPVPGETKIWQYVTLMRRIYLIDCPGVVYDVGDNEDDTVLKGVVRAERLPEPSDFVRPILERVRDQYIKKHYQIDSWVDHIDFLKKLALRSGKLSKGGEPELRSISINVINDWQRGKLPHFVAPPDDVEK
jgi:nuclear GTP-binding protein